MQDEKTPSEDCDPVTQQFEVTPYGTVELQLLVQCVETERGRAGLRGERGRLSAKGRRGPPGIGDAERRNGENGDDECGGRKQAPRRPVCLPEHGA